MCSACAGVSQEQELASTAKLLPHIHQNSPKNSDTDQRTFVKKLVTMMKKEEQTNRQLSRKSLGVFVPDQGPHPDR
eukprot:3133798-Rhodomonas_salina.1